MNKFDPWGLCPDDWIDTIFNIVSVALIIGDIALLGPSGEGMVPAAVIQTNKVVIGETAKRVATAAKRIGAEYYMPLKDVAEIGLKKAMRNNYQWLRRQYLSSKRIVDIGVDKARQTGRGIFYEAEERWLNRWRGK